MSDDETTTEETTIISSLPPSEETTIISSLPPSEPVAHITEGAELRTLDEDMLDGAASGSEGGQVGRYDKILYQLALFMIPTGFVLIVLGWYGTSRTVFVFEQLPYIVSGGILGAALLITGGLIYVGVWIERVAHQQRHQAEQTAELLALLRGDVQELTTTTAEAVRGNGSSGRKAPATAPGSRTRKKTARKKKASGRTTKRTS
jgi:hypothetical protein